MQDRDLYLSNNLTQSLTDVFTTIGETAQKTETPICFFIDEIQYMKQNQLGSLIAALHRNNQLGYPVMIVGAGLPKIYKMLSDEKSYSERLFVYKQVDSLTYEQSKKAIEEPVRKFHVSYTENAIKKIVEITKEASLVIWDNLKETDTKYISFDFKLNFNSFVDKTCCFSLCSLLR